VSCGKKPAWETPNWARAWSRFAREAANCWLFEAASVSRRFNSASPKISHQAPRGKCAAGEAGFQSELVAPANAAGVEALPNGAGRL